MIDSFFLISNNAQNDLCHSKKQILQTVTDPISVLICSRCTRSAALSISFCACEAGSIVPYAMLHK